MELRIRWELQITSIVGDGFAKQPGLDIPRLLERDLA
jgi:hypothetical protein